MVYPQVTFHLETQDIQRLEAFYADEFLPVILDHGFEPVCGGFPS